MGRSQGTFNKRENEKKKLKKRQDKEERKEERKANKGQSLDSMIAYVDEFGNFSSTPPDPDLKKDIAAEDILIGVPKQEHLPVDTIHQGVVSFFNESKGYGFIKDKNTQESIFVHQNGLVDTIKENNLVTFEVESTPKGLTAVNVRKAVQ